MINFAPRVAAFAAVLVLLSILLTACFRWIDPPTTSFMLQSWFAAHSKNRDDYRLRHYWVDWDEISTSAKVAVIASEDQRFLRHAGFDLESIADALYERIKRNRHRGASTISQPSVPASLDPPQNRWLPVHAKWIADRWDPAGFLTWFGAGFPSS